MVSSVSHIYVSITFLSSKHVSEVVLFVESSYGVAAAAAKLLQSCQTLCDPLDSSPPGSSVPGILQARILECVASPFSNA